MISQEKINALTTAVQCDLSVNQGPRRTLLVVKAQKGILRDLQVSMPTEVWREFCRRQLAVPPPLPQGGKP